jgi:small-conductance mechanosensitive channel/CRP-like cAMP-binding protein
LRSIGLPALILVVSLTIYVTTANLSEAAVTALGLTTLVFASLRVGMTVLVWGAGAAVLTRLMDLLVWQRFADDKGSFTVPRLLVSLSRGIIWVLAAVLAATHLNGEPPLAIITTSSVLVAVIGLALREMIADVASGVVFSFDRPVSIGDHISLRNSPILKVEDITWRAARLRSLDGSLLVVPNGSLARFELTNYGAGTRDSRFTLDVCLPYHLTQEQVDPVLEAAVRSVALAKGITIKSDIMVTSFDENGVNWCLRYWIPNARIGELGNLMRRAVLRQLRLAGMEPARARQDVLHAETPPPPTVQQRLVGVLADLPIFATLEPADHAAIVAKGRLETVLAGAAPIVTQGEAGDSMYVILSGEVGIDIPLPNGETRRVAHLVAGAVFGEMSLLTGEARSATVVPVSNARLFRIDRAALQPMFERYPELPMQLGEILAQRQLANAKAQQASDAANSAAPPPRETLVADMARRIRGFFRMGG